MCTTKELLTVLELSVMNRAKFEIRPTALIYPSFLKSDGLRIKLTM